MQAATHLFFIDAFDALPDKIQNQVLDTPQRFHKLVKEHVQDGRHTARAKHTAATNFIESYVYDAGYSQKLCSFTAHAQHLV